MKRAGTEFSFAINGWKAYGVAFTQLELRSLFFVAFCNKVAGKVTVTEMTIVANFAAAYYFTILSFYLLVNYLLPSSYKHFHHLDSPQHRSGCIRPGL